jgi:hypothetical protein
MNLGDLFLAYEILLLPQANGQACIDHFGCTHPVDGLF